jgi:hypothetical protein
MIPRPYRKLLSAILNQAIQDIWRHRYNKKRGAYRRRKRRKNETARQWRNHCYFKKYQHDGMCADHDQAVRWLYGSPGAFRYKEICGYLGIDPIGFRARILDGPPKGYRPKIVSKLIEEL